MKLLALDSSAAPASCALWEDGRILAEFYIHVKLTHSQTLMPMVQGMLDAAGLAPAQLDGFAVSAGPGSFTGVRIGVAALKGMAWPLDKPCAAVSTLEAMAENLRGADRPERTAASGILVGADGPSAPETDGGTGHPAGCAGPDAVNAEEADALLCCVMDARCNQVYNALFLRRKGEICRLCPDRALLIDQLAQSLEETRPAGKVPIILTGDGAELCYRKLADRIPGLRLAPEPVRFQRASGVAAAAARAFARGDTVSAEALQPIYLRLPQAERELKKKLSQQQEEK